MVRHLRLLVVGLGTLAVGAGGWLGYIAFAGAEAGAEAGAGLGLGMVALAAGTGMGVFFAPCSFPLLLTHITAHRGDGSFVPAFASGAMLFFAGVAALVLAGGEGLATVLAFDTVPGRIFRGLIALGLAVLGLQQIGIAGLRAPGRLAVAAGRLLHPTQAGSLGVGYGFAYPLVGFG